MVQDATVSFAPVVVAPPPTTVGSAEQNTKRNEIVRLYFRFAPSYRDVEELARRARHRRDRRRISDESHHTTLSRGRIISPTPLTPREAAARSGGHSAEWRRSGCGPTACRSSPAKHSENQQRGDGVAPVIHADIRNVALAEHPHPGREALQLGHRLALDVAREGESTGTASRRRQTSATASADIGMR